MDLQSRSYWLGLDDYTRNDPLHGDLRADVVLFGGGFTGLWTALLLLKERPDLDVVIREANARAVTRCNRTHDALHGTGVHP